MAAAQERHGPLRLARAFAALAVQRSNGSQAAGSGGGDSSSVPPPDDQPSSSSCALPLDDRPKSEDTEQESAVLLPLSEEMRGRRRFCADLRGLIWLASGFHTRCAADSLAVLLQSILT